MSQIPLSFFTVALFYNGKCQSEDLHLRRLSESLDIIHMQNDWDQILDLWSKCCKELIESIGWVRFKVTFFYQVDQWVAKHEHESFVLEKMKLMALAVHELNHSRWLVPPGLVKSGEGHTTVMPIYERYLADGYDEVIFLGQNADWGDSFFSSVGVLIEGELCFAPSSCFVQQSTSVLRLIADSRLSPWPVKIKKLNWENVDSKSVLFLCNAVKGPRIVGRIFNKDFVLRPEIFEAARLFNNRWYNFDTAKKI